MKKIYLLLVAFFALSCTQVFSQIKPATAHVEDANGNSVSGQFYRINAGASRGVNGSSNAAFGNIGDWCVDLTISEKTPTDATNSYGNDPRMYNGGFGALARASFAAGNYTRASSLGAVAMGFLTIAGADQDGAGPFNGIDGGNVGQVAFGWRSIASGNGAVAMGHGSTASGSFSFASGSETTASGEGSVALGIGTSALAKGSVAIGSHNLTSDALFVVGNGEDDANPSDAFMVFNDGSAVLKGDLTINSDRRLKTNITSLGSTLDKLLLIDGKSYNMKTDMSKTKIGVIAQDVQSVFPELVKEGTDADGTLSVNYQGLIPVLINAINEQQAEIAELRRLINAK